VRAVAFDWYGPPEVLRLEEVERPAPMPGEVLVEDVVEAHRYVETRQKTGNVLLSLNGGPR
jgi:NADPH:quinone reductase-like Zn-dependent oxidoreductase